MKNSNSTALIWKQTQSEITAKLSEDPRIPLSTRLTETESNVTKQLAPVLHSHLMELFPRPATMTSIQTCVEEKMSWIISSTDVTLLCSCSCEFDEGTPTLESTVNVSRAPRHLRGLQISSSHFTHQEDLWEVVLKQLWPGPTADTQVWMMPSSAFSTGAASTWLCLALLSGLIFDFCRAFNTFLPHQLQNKLKAMQVDPHSLLQHTELVTS